MANFSYQAINESGANVKGSIEADSVEMAENLLLSKGYIPSRVAAASGAAPGGSFLAKIKESLSKVKIGERPHTRRTSRSASPSSSAP